MHNTTEPIVRVFKPHGSADFDLEGITRENLTFPLRAFCRMNNFPFKIHPSERDWHPPAEAVIVLPYESNPYSDYQWVAPGYSIFSQLGPRLTHLVVIGLSYHPADRPEIDHFLFSTSQSCLIGIASPNPDTELIDKIRDSGREFFLWTEGPQDLPLRNLKTCLKNLCHPTF